MLDPECGMGGLRVTNNCTVTQRGAPNAWKAAGNLCLLPKVFISLKAFLTSSKDADSLIHWDQTAYGKL